MIREGRLSSHVPETMECTIKHCFYLDNNGNYPYYETYCYVPQNNITNFTIYTSYDGKFVFEDNYETKCVLSFPPNTTIAPQIVVYTNTIKENNKILQIVPVFETYRGRQEILIDITYNIDTTQKYVSACVYMSDEADKNDDIKIKVYGWYYDKYEDSDKRQLVYTFSIQPYTVEFDVEFSTDTSKFYDFDFELNKNKGQIKDYTISSYM